MFYQICVRSKHSAFIEPNFCNIVGSNDVDINVVFAIYLLNFLRVLAGILCKNESIYLQIRQHNVKLYITFVCLAGIWLIDRLLNFACRAGCDDLI